ncbi:MAG: tRNA (adenosine(37)-N6)-threonylcarbamoyltransferase complex ATPase subunit type 1 TsaE [Spirochaetales bacterium]|nr:tRNA (adenosine(37)-N6)-threonylcarbamoyltransferase complex ATPase subunit type 1 TsaE [Spirochaetales bacterium]
MASALRGGEVITLRAPLAAGKTVLAKGIARGLGVTDIVTSPTYTIVSEYAGRLQLTHVDLYRIDGEEEYDQLAVNELIDSGTVVVIEWPERAGTYLPEGVLAVEITIEPNGDRTVNLPGALTPSREDGTRP